MWQGAAAVCVNDRREVLMVKQGTPEEPKVWALPSGGLEAGETYEACCVREVWEETGYRVQIKRPLHTKQGQSFGIDVHVEYFEVECIGGNAVIQDPDGLIHEIAWQSAERVRGLELSFPEDLELILSFLE